jgi:hypothetical protein
MAALPLEQPRATLGFEPLPHARGLLVPAAPLDGQPVLREVRTTYQFEGPRGEAAWVYLFGDLEGDSVAYAAIADDWAAPQTIRADVYLLRLFETIYEGVPGLPQMRRLDARSSAEILGLFHTLGAEATERAWRAHQEIRERLTPEGRLRMIISHDHRAAPVRHLVLQLLGAEHTAALRPEESTALTREFTTAEELEIERQIDEIYADMVAGI